MTSKNNFGWALFISGGIASFIGQKWLGDTLGFYMDHSKDFTSDWFRAEYSATFAPAILTAIGYTAVGAAFLIWGTYHESKDSISNVLGVLGQILGIIIILANIWIMIMRITTFISLH